MAQPKTTYTRQIELLRAIKIHEPVTCPQLAKIVGKTRQAMHVRLRQMERRGLIERVPPVPHGPTVPIHYRCSYQLREMEKELHRQAKQEEDRRLSQRGPDH